jgi:hypothetical protein
VNLLERALTRLDDALNPIVVKELRQAVQGKFITGILILFLFFQIGTLGFSLIDRAAASNFELGRETFTVLMMFVLLAGTLAVPIYSGYRFATERSDLDSDLLFITTITPAAIIRGKFQAAMAIVLLFYAVSLPYMTITYFFRGIDLLSIFWVVVFSLSGVVLNLSICLFIACLPLNFPLRVMIGLCALIPLFWVFGGSVAMVSEFLRMGIGARVLSWAFWRDLFPSVLLFGFGLGLLYVLSVAAIAPAPTNRAYGIRRFVSAFWALSLLGMTFYAANGGGSQALGGWIIFATLVFSAFLPVAVSERTWCGRRVARTIPGDALGRRLAFLFYSGAAGGLIWALTFMVLTHVVPVFALPVIGATNFGSSFEHDREGVIILALYTLGYSLLGALVRRLFLADRVPVASTWFLALLLAGLGGAVPPILGFILFGSDREEWLLGNPLLALQSTAWRESCLLFAAGFAGVLLLVNLPWMKSQWEQFRPYGDEEPPPDGEDAPALPV